MGGHRGHGHVCRGGVGVGGMRRWFAERQVRFTRSVDVTSGQGVERWHLGLYHDDLIERAEWLLGLADHHLAHYAGDFDKWHRRFNDDDLDDRAKHIEFGVESDIVGGVHAFARGGCSCRPWQRVSVRGQLSRRRV